METRLARYKGRIYYMDCDNTGTPKKDHRGNFELISIKNNAEGVMGNPLFTHEITGPEYIEQMEAIKYFNNKKKSTLILQELIRSYPTPKQEEDMYRDLGVDNAVIVNVDFYQKLVKDKARLLEALKELRQWCGDNFHGEDSGLDLTLADKAITKAEGGSQ